MLLPARAWAATLRSRGVRYLGVFHRPAGPEGRRFPAVLFLHGFPGSEKNVDIARELLRRGIASLALHFGGAWGSGGLYRFTRLVPEARMGLAWLARQPFVDRRRLGVFGFSMGGWAALNLAAEGRGLRACAAVAPVGGPEMVRPDTRSMLARLSAPLNAPPADELAQDFIRAVRRWDPAAAAARLKSPLLLVHGQSDDLIPPAVSERIQRAAAPGRSRLVRAAGARHDFLDRRPWLCRLAASWLEKRLTP